MNCFLRLFMQLAIYKGSFVMLLQKHLLEMEAKDWKTLIEAMQLCELLHIVYKDKFCFPSPVCQFALVLQSWNCCYPCTLEILPEWWTIRNRESILWWQICTLLKMQVHKYLFFFLTMPLFLSYVFTISNEISQIYNSLKRFSQTQLKKNGLCYGFS